MLRTAALALALALWVVGAFAHPNGHGSLEDDDIRVVASSAAAYFVTTDVGREWGTLPESWAAIPLNQTEILARVDGYFVVAVRNQVEDQILYVLVAYNGSVLDANFTGTFPYVYDAQNPEATATD